MATFDIALPYRTDWREMIGVLDYCKGKGADRGSLEARFGGGESLRETLNALEQLRLIERSEAGDVRLSHQGDRLAYAPEPAQLRARLVETLLSYAPYRYPLERAAADGMSVLEGPWVEHIWQVDMRLGQPRNRVEEARTFLFRLCDEAGLGVYRRGVRGQTTRLDLQSDAAERLRRELVALDEARRVSPVTPPAQLPVAIAEPGPSAEPAADSVPLPAGMAAPGSSPLMVVSTALPSGVPATLNIQVDFSGWELEKIEAFLRLIGYLPSSSGR